MIDFFSGSFKKHIFKPRLSKNCVLRENNCRALWFGRIYGRGFSFVELLVAVVIIAISISPIFLTMSSARRTSVSASKLSRAASYASAYITALRSLKSDSIEEFDNVRDESLSGPLSLANLHADKTSDEFIRKVSIKKLDLEEFDESNFYHVVIAVIWKGNSGKINEYSLEGLIDVKK